MNYFLGLDIGTSGVKAALVDEKGRVKAAVTKSHPLFTPQPGWAEQRPDDWWKSAAAAAKGVLAAARLRPNGVAAVGLSGQMHSSVFLDKENRVIRPALLWCDGRTSEECRDITRVVGEDRLREWVSNPALEGFTLPKVLWLKKHEPESFARLAKVVLAKDYVRYRLTGALASEPSDASATLMYDTAGRRWSTSMTSCRMSAGAPRSSDACTPPRRARRGSRQAHRSSAEGPTMLVEPSESVSSRPVKRWPAGGPRAPFSRPQANRSSTPGYVPTRFAMQYPTPGT